jgi:NAD(P)-dependent dehydrogenase (short-subunit alcohol dehydrogenase family)
VYQNNFGQGKLLVCASDLPALQVHPEARQLMHSLLRYVASPAFAPTAELDGKLLSNHEAGQPSRHRNRRCQRHWGRHRALFYSVHPLGRIASAEEIGRVAVFLACDDSGFVTGTALPVDGAVTLGY